MKNLIDKYVCSKFKRAYAREQVMQKRTRETCEICGQRDRKGVEYLEISKHITEKGVISYGHHFHSKCVLDALVNPNNYSEEKYEIANEISLLKMRRHYNKK